MTKSNVKSSCVAALAVLLACPLTAGAEGGAAAAHSETASGSPSAAEEPRVFELEEGFTFKIDLLKRKNKEVVLFRYTITNTSDTMKRLDASGFIENKSLSFIDLSDRKEYKCVHTGWNCVGAAPSRNESVRVGQSVKGWGYFTAPPVGVKKISLRIGESPPIDDVEIAP